MVYAYLILPTGDGVDEIDSQIPNLQWIPVSDEPGVLGRSQSHKGLSLM